MLDIRKLLMGIGLGVAVVSAGCAPKESEPAATTETEAAAPAADAAVSTPAPETAAPAETAPAPEAAAPAAEAASAEGEHAAVNEVTDASAPFGDDALVKDLAPAGWKQTGPIEHYNVAALYNKINGRSELYMAYDVLGLSWVSFVQESNSDNFLDLFVYDMRTPKSGFGIYSVEREPGQTAASFGRMSYQTGSNFYFWQGKYYGYVNASRQDDANTAAAQAILTGLMPRLVDTGEAVDGLDWLPSEGLIQDTVQYFKVDAMSLDFLDDTFAGMYQHGDAKVRGFVSRRASEEEAAGIQTSFGQYSKDYANGAEPITVDGVEAIMADWGGVFDAAFHIGSTFAGITNVEGKDNAQAALGMMIKQIKAQQK